MAILSGELQMLRDEEHRPWLSLLSDLGFLLTYSQGNVIRDRLLPFSLKMRSLCETKTESSSLLCKTSWFQKIINA